MQVRPAGQKHRFFLGQQWFLLIVVTLSCVMYVSGRPVLSGAEGLPVGIDTLGHLARIEAIARQWVRGDFSDWFAEWYMGSTLSQYYPPLSLWVGAIVQMITRNILLTYRILCVTCMTWAGIEAARLTSRIGGPFSACIVASLVYSTANYNLFTVFVDGTLGRILVLPLVPWLVRVLIDCLEYQSLRHRILAGSILAAMILAHVLQAYQSCLLLIPLFLVLCVQKKNFKGLLTLAEVVISGVLAVSFWLIPGTTQLEMTGVPWSPPEIVSQTSIGLTSLLSPESPFALTVIFAAGLVGFCFAYRSPDKQWYAIALMSSVVVGISFLKGPYNPMFALLPVRETIRPLRFVNGILVPVSVLSGYGVSMLSDRISLRHSLGRDLAITALSLLFLAICFAANPGPSLAAPDAYASISVLVDAVPASEPGFGSGRLVTELPRQGGESAYLPVARGLNLVGGWSIEGTQHQYTFYDHNIAYDAGNYQYVIRNWDLWNVQYAILDDKYQDMVDYLKKAEWTEIIQLDGMTLLTSGDDSMYIESMDSSAIAIGRSSNCVAFLLPWIVQGREPDPLSYDDEYLSGFDTIFLYDLPNVDIGRLEKRVVDWARQGKRVVIDLSVSNITSFLGVKRVDALMDNTVTLVSSESDESLSFEVSEGNGATYSGLDAELARISGSGDVIAGIREIQSGSVYFVGGHIPRLVNPKATSSAAKFLEWFLPPTIHLDEQRLSCGAIERVKGGVKFSYSADVQTHALVSISYSPRWQATLNTVESVPVYNHENLVLLMLPAGSHQVELTYRLTRVAVFANLMSLLFAGGSAVRIAYIYFAHRREARGWTA